MVSSHTHHNENLATLASFPDLFYVGMRGEPGNEVDVTMSG